MIIVYPPIPISTANSRRAPAPALAPNKTGAETFLDASGSSCHGLAPRMKAATMRTPCWMTCLAHHRRSALAPGQELVEVVLAVRLMFLCPLEVKRASRSSRSLASRARWRFKRLIMKINGLTSFDIGHFRAQRHFRYVFYFFNPLRLETCLEDHFFVQRITCATGLMHTSFFPSFLSEVLRKIVASSALYFAPLPDHHHLVEDNLHRNGVYSGYTSTVKSQSEIDKRSDLLRNDLYRARIHMLQSDQTPDIQSHRSARAPCQKNAKNYSRIDVRRYKAS